MDNPEKLYQKAIGLEKKNQYHQALICYEKAISLLANNPKLEYQIYISRGKLKTDLSDFQGALADFTHLIEIDSTYTEAYFQRAIAYDILALPQKALEDYSYVIEHDKKLKPEALTKRSCIYFIMGNKAIKKQLTEKAIHLFKQALVDDPTNKLAKKHLNRLTQAPSI